MKSVTLGNSDIRVSALAWGCWRLSDARTARLALDALTDTGINFIDTAAIYGYGSEEGAGHAEALLGAAIKKRADSRDQWVIASKGGLELPVPYNSSRDYLIRECEESLQRLGVETLDLYMIHRPDWLTSAEEAAEALDTLVRSGKIRSAGVSNYSPSQVAALRSHLNAPLLVNQIEFSANHVAPLQDGTLDLCQQYSMTAMAWSPLAGGALTQKANDTSASHLWRLGSALDRIAANHGVSRGQVALAYVLQVPCVLPIIGSQNPARIREAAIATTIALSRREWYEITEARLGQPMP